MKTKIVLSIMLAIVMLMSFSGNAAYALRTSYTIRVRLIVEGNVSMDLGDEWVRQNLHKPEAEAFSELKEKGILVDKVKRDSSTIWLFTKTE